MQKQPNDQAKDEVKLCAIGMWPSKSLAYACDVQQDHWRPALWCKGWAFASQSLVASQRPRWSAVDVLCWWFLPGKKQLYSAFMNFSWSVERSYHVTNCLTKPKCLLHLGCFNVRTLYQIGKQAVLAGTIEIFKIDECYLSGTHIQHSTSIIPFVAEVTLFLASLFACQLIWLWALVVRLVWGALWVR